ncbi:MAG TPA: hypothetical protein VMF52_21600 [Steroidobacteraceae bacterium]|nr:hypothetical protein [Steroidobacteraceae bacterium]
MARSVNLEFSNRAGEYAACLSPSALEQFKLERLVELRAVIDSLRSERSSTAIPPAKPRGLGSRQ